MSPLDKLNDVEKEMIQVAIGCAKTLDSLSSSPKIKEELRKCGMVFIISRFIKSDNLDLIVPLTGAIQQCADLKSLQIAFEQTGVMTEIVRHMQKENIYLKENCAMVIFKCAVNKTTRDLVREIGGLDSLCDLVRNEEMRKNKKLLAAVSGALWKCASSPENVARFKQNELVLTLTTLLEEDEDEDVLTNVIGALAECCKDKTNREILRVNDAIPKLINLLSMTYEPLLENLPLVFKECAESPECMAIINDTEHVLDGVRLIWSLLKHPSNSVKRNACLALVPCLRNSKDAPEMARAFMGALELTVSLLESKDPQVLSAACATIAEIARDPENLGILTDYDVVRKLANLVHIKNEGLRANLTLAIAFCCDYEKNNYEFGRLKTIEPLAQCLTSRNKDVKKGVCIAFYHLSKEPLNCVTMHACGAVKHILRLVGSEDPQVQIAAANTIRNIRKLALSADKS